MLPYVALAALAALLLSPGLLSGPSLDPSVFTYVSERVTEGARLYRDVWDHKPPGVYYTYAAFQFLLPWANPWHVTWLVSLAATTLTGASVLTAIRRLGVRPGAALFAAAGVVGAMAQYLTALGGGLTEPLATLPACVALILAVSPGLSWRRSMVIGVFLAAALITSLILLPGALAVAAMTIARPGSPRERLARAAAGAAGGVVVIGLVGGKLWLLGVLDDALSAIVAYTGAYRASGAAFGAQLSGPVATWTLLSYLFLIVPAALGVLSAFRADLPRRVEAMASVAWIGLAILTYAVQGRFFAHYAIPLAVPLGLLAGLGFERLGALRLTRTSELARVPLYAPFVLAFLISVPAGTAGARMEWLPVERDHDRSLRVAAVLRRVTGARDTIFVWGNNTHLYLDADRRAAGPYSFLYPLSTPGYTTEGRVASLLAELEAAPPAVVVDAGSPAPGIGGFLPLLIDRPVGTDGRTLDLLDPLRDFVRQGYEELGVVDGWVLYIRRDP